MDPSSGQQRMPHPLQLFRPKDVSDFCLYSLTLSAQNYTHIELIPETLKVLLQIKGPIVLVTIVGTQRGGKSTLLNLLHSRKTSGFGLGTCFTT